jgi:hypothetical protein
LPGNTRYGSGVARRTPWNPNTAEWLVKQRGKRTQDAVIEDMAARGVKVKRAWLSRIENGAPFSDELLAAFEDYYGSVPPAYEPEPAAQPVDQSAIVAAIDRQTAMLERVLIALGGRGLDPENQAAARELELEARSRSDPALHPETDTAR